MKPQYVLIVAALIGLIACGASDGSDGGPGPAIGLGVPWRKCSTPWKQATECTVGQWTASPYSKNPSLVLGECKSGWCRADLVEGKQCVVGDTTTCGSTSSGQTTCDTSGWGICSAP